MCSSDLQALHSGRAGEDPGEPARLLRCGDDGRVELQVGERTVVVWTHDPDAPGGYVGYELVYQDRKSVV